MAQIPHGSAALIPGTQLEVGTFLGVSNLTHTLLRLLVRIGFATEVGAKGTAEMFYVGRKWCMGSSILGY